MSDQAPAAAITSTSIAYNLLQFALPFAICAALAASTMRYESISTHTLAMLLCGLFGVALFFR